MARFPLDALPDDAHRLLKLLYSLVLVSFPVEIWKQPYIPDTGTAQFELKIEPGGKLARIASVASSSGRSRPRTVVTRWWTVG